MRIRMKQINVVLENIYVKELFNTILDLSKKEHDPKRKILWRKSEYQLYRISKEIYKETLQ